MKKNGQSTTGSQATDTVEIHMDNIAQTAAVRSAHESPDVTVTVSARPSSVPSHVPSPIMSQRKRSLQQFQEDAGTTLEENPPEDSFSQQSNVSVLTERGRGRREEAFTAAMMNTQHGAWVPIGLISTSDNHSIPELDLGSD